MLNWLDSFGGSLVVVMYYYKLPRLKPEDFFSIWFGEACSEGQQVELLFNPRDLAI